MTRPYRKQGMSSKELSVWLEDQCEKTPDGCWLWHKAKNQHGYGLVRHRYVTYIAHRWLKEYRDGRCPEGMESLHLCHIRNCLNPAHIVWGTHSENEVAKSMVGNHKSRRLSDKEVILIRDLYSAGASQKDLGDHFGVTPQAIGYIVRRQIYKWIPESSEFGA